MENETVTKLSYTVPVSGYYLLNGTIIYLSAGETVLFDENFDRVPGEIDQEYLKRVREYLKNNA